MSPTNLNIVTTSLGSPRAIGELSLDDRRGAYEMLLKLTVDGELPYGAVSKVAKQFSCHRTTISRLWARARRFGRGHCIKKRGKHLQNVYFPKIYQISG